MSLTVGTDTYLSLDDADTYFGNRLHTDTWDAASDDDKEAALKMACSLMENRVHWLGAPTDSSQALSWPRRGLLDHSGNAVPKDTTPEAVKAVQCELAAYLLDNDPMTVPGGIEKIDLEGLELDVQANAQTIPTKIFRPIEIYGQLLDAKANFNVSRYNRFRNR
jgi:hypothetical protein